MIKKIHILFSLLVMFTIASAIAQDQDGKRVCKGSRIMYYADPGDRIGSTFEYKLPEGSQLAKEYSDSIVVQWGTTAGDFQLGVREFSDRGCPGDWAYLDVSVVGTDIKFNQTKFNLCEGDSVYVDFNRNDFQGYSWVESSINKNNYIHKAGTYELRAIDKDQCRTSASITVLTTHKPHVNLGSKDTMICTPGFKLYALNPNTNPQGTIFSWSTGESGTSSFLEVNEHDTKQEVLYWVQAEYLGCTASDTIVVLACDEGPLEELKIPNTFTPNGDGDNDVWRISALRQYPNAIVEVFDRWGRKVFTSTKGYTEPWDGHDAKGHVLPMETYYYIIHLNDGVHNKPLVGTITIIR